MNEAIIRITDEAGPAGGPPHIVLEIRGFVLSPEAQLAYTMCKEHAPGHFQVIASHFQVIAGEES